MSLMSPLVAVMQLTVLLSSDAKVVGGRACTPGLKRSRNGNKDLSVLTITPVIFQHTEHTPSRALCHTPSLLTTLLVEWYYIII